MSQNDRLVLDGSALPPEQLVWAARPLRAPPLPGRLSALNDSQELFPFICVREPYFALEEVRMDGAGRVEARVPAQQPLGLEAGPMSAAEAGRHLAILGLCGASRLNPRPERHYYLASEGRLLRHTDTDEPSRGAPERLWGRAQAVYDGGRTARASAELLMPSGQRLYTLEVSYHVISERAFGRLFKASRCETPAARPNPYEQTVSLRQTHREEGRLCFRLEPVRPAQCAGHFEGHPALPVAILASVLIEAAGRLLCQRLGGDPVRYRVRGFHINAERLAFAGESPSIEARHLHSSGNTHRFACKAVPEHGQPFSDMLVELEPC